MTELVFPVAAAASHYVEGRSTTVTILATDLWNAFQAGAEWGRTRVEEAAGQWDHPAHPIAVETANRQPLLDMLTLMPAEAFGFMALALLDALTPLVKEHGGFTENARISLAMTRGAVRAYLVPGNGR